MFSVVFETIQLEQCQGHKQACWREDQPEMLLLNLLEVMFTI